MAKGKWSAGRTTHRGARNGPVRRRVGRFETLENRLLLAGDVTMFNDHIAGPLTHPFVTSFSSIETSSGLLRDSETGANTPITLETLSTGASFENASGIPARATAAGDIFAGWVDFSTQPGSSIAVSGADAFTHRFTGLDFQSTYEFTGTAVRGNLGYTNRWTLVTLVGADSFVPTHVAGVGIVTAGLPANQVAVWTGENHLGTQGYIARWDDIDPGADGAFDIVSQQYQGPTPGVGSGNSSSGSKGYALTAVRLVEHDPSFHVSSTDPADGAVLTVAPTMYTVNFSLPVDAGSVDASDLTVDGMPATSVQIVDPETIEFTLPAVSGNGFHSIAIAEGALTSGGGTLPLSSLEATFAILSGSGVVINEIGYDVSDDSEPLEFVELLNVSSSAVDLSGWQLDDAVSYTIPGGTVLASGAYLIIAQHPGEFTNEFGIGAVGPFNGRLSNSGETVVLVDGQGTVRDEVDYNLGFPWPTVGDVPGYSIQLISPALENDLGGNWRSAAATPGASNSVFAFNSAPQMRKVSHSPEAPSPGEDVTITMKVTDPDGITSVELEYQLVDPGDYIAITDERYDTSWTTLVMRDDGTGDDAVAGDDIFTAVLPGSLQLHRRLVRYRVTAVDTLGLGVTAPYADDPQPNFAYFVYDAVPDWTGAAQPGVTPNVTYDGEVLDSVATYHLITTREAHEDAQFIPDSSLGGGYTGSNYLWHGALVYDGVVYDHVRFRARGGVWRYAMGKNMWKFDFNRGHDFQASDDYGNAYDESWRKLNLSAIIQQGNFWHRGEQGLFESVGFRLFDLAGVPASNTNYVQFRVIESADEDGSDQYSGDFQGLYLAIEQLDGRFLDQHGLPDGNLYKMENGTGVSGIGGDSNNQGDYPAVNDSSDLIDFKTTYESGPQSAQWWEENFNLEQYYSYRSIVEGIHHYDIGNGKNYFYYLNPETNLWETIPWDLDLTWANNMFGNGNEPFRNRVLEISQFARDYRNRMREIRDLLYNSEQAGWLVDEVASHVYTAGQPSLVDADRAMWDYNPILTSDYVNPSKAEHGRFYAGGEGIPATDNFAGMIQLLKDYVVSQGSFIDATILTDENQVPNTPTITYTGEAGFPINELEFTSSAYSSPGSGFGAMEWRIGEISNPDTPVYQPGTPWIYEIEPVWESGELSTFNSTIDTTAAGLTVGHTYRARVRMQDNQGRWSHWSDPVEFVAAAAVGVPTLSITELHYHPNNPGLADESDQEFIEILNTGDQPVDLSGLQIADFAGEPYVFAGGLTLDPGQYMVIARTPSVFESIYGSGINVAAGGYANANLSNGGETISLRTAAGATFFTFTYSDDSPWPEAADGDGPSLEIIDPLGDPNDPTNWRASAADGGSPGDNGEPSSDLAGDYDNSGTVDDLDYDEWRDQYGTFVANPGDGADGNQDGLVNTADYIVWRNNFGATVAVAATVPTPSVNPQPVVDENEPADLPPVALNLTAESRNRFEVRRYEPRLLTRDASFDELLLTAISATPNHVATVEDIFQTPADDPTDVHPNAISAALDELFPDQLAATQLSSF
jgi:hypothetical protein